MGRCHYFSVALYLMFGTICRDRWEQKTGNGREENNINFHNSLFSLQSKQCNLWFIVFIRLLYAIVSSASLSFSDIHFVLQFLFSDPFFSRFFLWLLCNRLVQGMSARPKEFSKMAGAQSLEIITPRLDSWNLSNPMSSYEQDIPPIP
jgi:hypothetical protein